MGIFDFLKRGSKEIKQVTYAKMMNGSIPVFSSFGTDVYASDIALNAVRILMEQMSKLNPKHIITDSESGMQNIVKSNLNYLLKFGPNELMTTSDFLTKIVYLYEKRNNVFIYPVWNVIDLGGGFYKREYTGLYPLNPINYTFLEDQSGTLYVKLEFLNGESYRIRYSNLIHWKKDFTENDFVGGDIQGEPRNDGLLKLLNADYMALQGIEKGIKTVYAVNGVLKINTYLEDEEQQKKVAEFEEKLKRNESGLLPMDLKGEYIPIKVDPKFIDKDTMEFIEKRILSNYGMSLSVYNGEFTEEEYQAFYERGLESRIVSLGRVFSKSLFTLNELKKGNEIIFYDQGLMYMNTKNKIEAVNILTNIGGLTDNQILAAFGYPPFAEGNIRHQSLNYINRDIAESYQLLNKGKKEDGNGK